MNREENNKKQELFKAILKGKMKEGQGNSRDTIRRTGYPC